MALQSLSRWWRYLLLLVILSGSLVLMLSIEPFGQDPAYHAFADRRRLLGIANFMDVLSNLPFLLVGLAGIRLCWSRALPQLQEPVRAAWLTLFIGIALVALGSSWYHLHPDNRTLVWDRLPMTIGFMGLFVALLGEYVNARLGRVLLFPAVLLGLSSVLYWYWFDDLRFYLWIQLLPLLLIPVIMLLFRSRYSHQWLLALALGLYLLAKMSERYDRQVFDVTGYLFSGHTLKHLLAAAGCAAILQMLRGRHQRGMLFK